MANVAIEAIGGAVGDEGMHGEEAEVTEILIAEQVEEIGTWIAALVEAGGMEEDLMEEVRDQDHLAGDILENG